MSKNKENKMKQDEIEQKEQEHDAELHTRYNEYVARIEKRKEAGEPIEVKEFDFWVKKVMRGEVEVIVPGESGETKNERFTRLAKARMTSTLHEMTLIINLSASQYEGTIQQKEQIITALRLKVLDIENAFKAQSKEENESFKFE